MKKIVILIIIYFIVTGCSSNNSIITKDYAHAAAPEKAVIMVIAAHPDDEAIFFGGTIPYYNSTLNLPVVYISMTAGWLKPDGSQKKSSIIREAEMLEAAWIYGLKHKPELAHFQQNIKYWPINKTWDRWVDCKLNGSDIESGKIKASRYIAEKIRLYKPEVIITHGFNGEYNNPDHKALAYSVSAAYDLAAGKETLLNDLFTGETIISPENINGEPWQTKKLYVHYSQGFENVINHLFHDFWEDLSIDTDSDGIHDKSPRGVANSGLIAYESQGRHYVSSVYDNRGRKEFNKYPSELWSLIKSEVGSDNNSDSFVINALSGDSIYKQWARGNFLQNLPFL